MIELRGVRVRGGGGLAQRGGGAAVRVPGAGRGEARVDHAGGGQGAGDAGGAGGAGVSDGAARVF